jgi:hypothetical protein
MSLEVDALKPLIGEGISAAQRSTAQETGPCEFAE